MAENEKVADWDRIFRPGVDMSVIPVAKWEHAHAKARQLRDEYNAYRNGSGDETISVYSEDRRRVTLTARLPKPPPIVLWSLLLGDAIHNYRSALDGLAWEVAHLDGNAVPAKYARSLYFPLAKTEDAWNDMQTKTLVSVPPVIRSRLETVQPYRFEPMQEGIGITLDKLDILDKHRSALTLALRVLDQQHFSVELATEAGSLDDFTYEFVAPDAPIADGVPVLVFEERQPVANLRVEKLPMVLGVDLDGSHRNIFDLLDLIERQVAGTFINVCVGFAQQEWQEFITNGGARPKIGWCPTVARYSDLKDVDAPLNSREETGAP